MRGINHLLLSVAKNQQNMLPPRSHVVDGQVGRLFNHFATLTGGFMVDNIYIYMYIYILYIIYYILYYIYYIILYYIIYILYYIYICIMNIT